MTEEILNGCWIYEVNDPIPIEGKNDICICRELLKVEIYPDPNVYFGFTS